MIKLSSRITAHALKAVSLLLGGVIGILCNFSGCRIIQQNVVEYGSPHADYVFNGTIRSRQSDSGIPAILVAVFDDTDNPYSRDSVLTDSAGNYTIRIPGVPADESWYVRARDIDSTLNGRYAEKDTLISVPRTSLAGGDGRWYEGAAETRVDMLLDETL